MKLTFAIGTRTVRKYVISDLCGPIDLKRDRLFLFVLSVGYVGFWDAAGYPRNG
jgi:hypothetical protein